jgi:RNA polymerase sigma factor (sigma-70 family)
MSLTQDEINDIAKKFIDLREQAKITKSEADRLQYRKYQNYCMDKLKFLVLHKVGKYRKFSNYPDLEQDGYEALVLALRTYNPNKGAFTWWADKYISTRVSRAANAHSTIRFPLKKAKETKPYKISIIPTIIDTEPTALESLESFQSSKSISSAVEQLPSNHQNVVNMLFGFNGVEQQSINNIIKSLSISRPQFLKIFGEAKIKLKEILQLNNE